MRSSRVLPLVLAASLMLTVRADADAQGNPQPGPWTATGSSLYATGPDVWVRLFGSDAAYNSYLFFVCDLTSSCEQFLFQNHDGAAVGQETRITTTFAVGQEVFFKLFVNNTNDAWFTGDASRNSDNYAHFATQSILDVTVNSTYTVLGGFEDTAGGGDQDHNDLMFEFGNVSVTATPEPASLVMLATGMLGLGVYVRRRRRSADV